MMKPSYWLNDTADEVQVRHLDSDGAKVMKRRGWLQITKDEFDRYERIFSRFAEMQK